MPEEGRNLGPEAAQRFLKAKVTTLKTTLKSSLFRIQPIRMPPLRSPLSAQGTDLKVCSPV